MSWTFQGIAYQTKRDYCAAIVREWLRAGGLITHEFVRKSFAEISDAELADQVIAASSLDGQQPPFDRDDIAQAFADYRKTVEASPVETHHASLRETILEQIRTVAAEQNRTLAPLTDDLALVDSGLDSLCFAILVARLEDMTGRDPLTSADDARFPRTVGEFIALYEEPVFVGRLSATSD
jgi:acyl carrier protein